MSRQRAYQLRHAARGRCVLCPRRAHFGRRCRRCHAAMQERDRRASTAYLPRAGVYCCGACGVRGHTRKVCRAEVQA